MRHLDPILAIDAYKSGHKYQYPEGTTLVFSNGTPRSARLFNSPLQTEGVIVAGLQGFFTWFTEVFQEGFFNKPKEQVLAKYQRRMDGVLGEGKVGVEHIAALHDLGYLPIVVEALPEGTLCPYGVPMYTLYNTLPEFAWIVNYLETIISSEIWKATNNATLAMHYRAIVERYARMTGVQDSPFLDFQCHDFSFRGMSGWHDAASTGIGHLFSFTGTDTLPAIDYIEEYYESEGQFIAGSIPATEHSVMCMGEKLSERETYRRLITEVYPSGDVAIVSDTWDYFNVLDNILPSLKEEIMSRDGKVVIRPDSGDPVHIIAGYRIESFKNRKHFEEVDSIRSITEVIWLIEENEFYRIIDTPDLTVRDSVNNPANLISPSEAVGSISCLWQTFGGTTNAEGYAELDSHIGLIYGDSITLQRAREILHRLEEKDFASTNVVFGVGSYTYQYNTRDSIGFAVKATAGVVNGQERALFKEPKTDVGGTKKSAKGFLKVVKDSETGAIRLIDNLTLEEFEQMDLDIATHTIFRDGQLNTEGNSLAEIRARVKQHAIALSRKMEGPTGRCTAKKI